MCREGGGGWEGEVEGVGEVEGGERGRKRKSREGEGEGASTYIEPLWQYC